MEQPLLLLQTFGATCAVGLTFPDGTLDVLVEATPNSHATHLPVFMQNILEKHHLEAEELAGVAVLSGPGSYTGLRIGVATAKGFCWGANLPLFAIPTFEAMAEAAKRHTELSNAQYLCTIDARRMEIYAALYGADGTPLMDTQPVILTEPPLPFSPLLSDATLFVLGDGSTKTLPFLPDKNVSTLLFEHYLTGAAPLAWEKWKNKEGVSLAYFEPFYLKAWGK